MDTVRASEIGAAETALRTTLEDMATMAAGDGVPVNMLIRAWRLADRLALAVDADPEADDRELEAAQRESAHLSAQLVRMERRLLDTVHH